MTRSIYAILTGLLVVSLPSARASDELPGDAETLVQKFQEEADAIQSKANQAIDTRKQKLVEDLKALRDSYAKAGKYDEALTLHEKIRSLLPTENVEVEWNGTWWPAEILKREGDKSYIRYTGWDESWNEWVMKARIRPPTRPRTFAPRR
jgi:agenet domain-containing protein